MLTIMMLTDIMMVSICRLGLNEDHDGLFQGQVLFYMEIARLDLST